MTTETYRCEHCEAAFTTQTEFSEHNRVRHGDALPGTRVCPQCGAKFEDEQALNRHGQTSH
jgi:uncharacterized C2H2 Zn-finger protein